MVKEHKCFRVILFVSLAFAFSCGEKSENGDAVQMYADWMGMNFQIQFTRFDMKFTSHINRFNRIYSPFGKLIKEEFEIFNFIEGGYPQLDIQRIFLLS